MTVYIGDKNITDVVAGNALDSAKQYADQGDANTLQQAKDYTDSEVSQVEADYKQADATVLSEAKQYADQNMIPKSQKGQSGGLAELDETGRVPSSQLPSYVDDVIDVDTYSNLPNPGEAGKIYITTDNNKQYRWSGTGYAEISSSLALGETSSTAYRGDRGKVAYEHSQIKSGNPHGTTFASLPDKPTSLPANGGNADTVDGLHSSDFARATQTPYVDIDTINDRGITGIGETAQATAERHYPIQEAGALFYSRSANYSANQIYGSYSSNRWFVRGGGNGPSEKTPWAEIWTTKNFDPSNYLNINRGTVDDLNNIRSVGQFSFAAGTLNTPEGMVGAGLVITWASSEQLANLIQLCSGYGSGGQFLGWFTRYRPSNVDWSPWWQVWSKYQFNPSNYISFNNTTAYTPTGQYNPATKGYVDSLVGTYILDMDNILDVVEGSSSTVSSSNQTMLEAIRSSVIAGNMPRVFGKEVSFDTSILTGISYGVTWQSTIVAPMSGSTTNVLVGLTAIVPSQPQNNMRCVSFIISTGGNITALSDSGWSSVGGTQEGLNIPASGEQAATGWTYNGKQVYIQRFTGAMQTGSGTTIQYASQSIPGISFIVSRSGTISNSSTNVYQIGDTIWAADGANSIMSTIQPYYSIGKVTLRIYDQAASSNWEYEYWIAYTK